MVLLFTISAEAQQWTGNAHLFLGAKALDKDDWEPVEGHAQVGILADFGQHDWPVHIAVGLLRSSADDTLMGVKFEAETTEINVGVRKIWDTHPTMRPFVGGGLAHINASFDGSSGGVRVSDSDSAIGFWLNAGIYWTLAESFNIGFDARISSASVRLYDISTNAGGGHFGLTLGYHW